MKLPVFFLITAALVFLFAVSCTVNPTQTSITTVIQPEIKIIPLQLNMFITPENNRQEKDFAIWSDTYWELAYTADWLDVSPKGNTETGNTLLAASAAGKGLKPGRYETEITVKSKDGLLTSTLPVVLSVLTEKTGTILDIPREIRLSDISPGATIFSNLNVMVGALSESVYNYYAGGQFDSGDPCIMVSGEFRNNTGNETLLLLSAEGYDGNGIQVSWGLSRGPIVGLANIVLPANSSIKTEITLS